MTEFTLLDHLAPCIPCLTYLRGHRRISLLHSPRTSNAELYNGHEQRDRLLDNEGNDDLLSLHSNVDGVFKKKENGSLSRFELLKSWWTSKNRGSSRRHTIYDDTGEQDAEELLPENISIPQNCPTNSPRRPLSPPLPTQEQLDAEEQELAQLEEESARRREARRIRRMQQKAVREQLAYSTESPRSAVDTDEWGPMQQAAPRLSRRSNSSRSMRSARSETSSEATSSVSGKRRKRSYSRRAMVLYTELEGSDTTSQSTAPTSVAEEGGEVK